MILLDRLCIKFDFISVEKLDSLNFNVFNFCFKSILFDELIFWFIWLGEFFCNLNRSVGWVFG